MVLLGSTVAAYVNQRGDIAALQDKVAPQQHDVAALQAEQEQWRDPAYVEQQARQRLKFVKPGERSYTVLDAEPVHRHRRPRARGGRTRRAAALVRDRLAVHPHRRRARGAPVTARADLPPVAQADLDAVSRQLGRAGPRRRRGGPPLPVRRTRRRAHRAAAARRHAVPDLVLRHLPPPHRRAVDAREPGRDARDERPARGRSRAARSGMPPRTSTTSSAAPSSVTCPRSPGSRPAACRPGSSACTCSSPTRSAPGPGSTRSATRPSRCSTRGGSATRARPTRRATPSGAAHDVTDAGSAP